MTLARAALLLAIALGTAPALRAQEEPADTSAVQTAIRAFYYNLDHRDWEAIAAQVLSAKIVAHRPAPPSLLADAASPDRGAGLGCGESRVTLLGQWAEVSVTRCAASTRGVDEFRLIRFENRWRIVYIALSPGSASIAGR